MVKEDLNQKRHEIQKEELEIYNLNEKIVDKMSGSDSENIKKKFLDLPGIILSDGSFQLFDINKSVSWKYKLHKAARVADN